jgi:hypothetical protein
LVILLSFGIFFPALVYCTKQNLATLFGAVKRPIEKPAPNCVISFKRMLSM